jgi:hypothetical protein
MKADKDKPSEDAAMVVLEFSYNASYVLPADKALDVLMAMSNAERYEHSHPYQERTESYHVWSESGGVKAMTLPRDLYLCAKLAGKRET